ncbi:MAG TPA: hypothetical protein VFO58_06070 [Vicinamibacterales bacterium]|nr:hypothetical protein [Vicinamibacterales bacterium]
MRHQMPAGDKPGKPPSKPAPSPVPPPMPERDLPGGGKKKGR